MNVQKILSYSRETLLTFASLPSCQTRPENIDPVLWRDSTSSDLVEANLVTPGVVSAHGLGQKDSDGGGTSIKSQSQDEIPEWRRPGGGGWGALLPPNTRRKPYDEEPVGNAFAANYPPRPGPPWVNTNGPPLRTPHDRPASFLPPRRWEHFCDRDRERGRALHDWEGDEPVAGGGGETGQHLSVERDGLLGSGNRPPPTGTRISKHVDSYQPPRPAVKTPAYGRHEDTDTVNDQTFGKLEASNDDRSLQEFKRRELFEMMRKEQHRQLQEHKQSHAKTDNPSVPRKHDENFLWDDHPHHSPPESPISKSTASIPLATPSRPAIPPGFSKVAQQKQNIDPELSLQDNHEQGVHNAAKKGVFKLEDNMVETEKKISETMPVVSSTEANDHDSRATSKGISAEILATTNEQEGDTSSPGGSLSVKHLQETADSWSFDLEDHNDRVPDDSTLSTDTIHSGEGTLLDKLFGKATPGFVNDDAAPPDFINDDAASPDFLVVEPSTAVSEEESWSEIDPKRSKFAQWFHSEEEKTSNVTTNSTSILSLFAKRDKVKTAQGESQQDGKLVWTHNQGHSVLPMPTGPSLEDIEKVMAAAAKESVSNSKGSNLPQFPINQDALQERRPPLPPIFMTCEDIEQSLLAEAASSDEPLGLQAFPSMGSSSVDATSASHHLLSLLQKQPSKFETFSNGDPKMEISGKEAAREWAWNRPEPSDQMSEVHTLEALFGKAFMSELQSSQPPLPESKFSDGNPKVEGTAPYFSQPGGKYPLNSGADEEGHQPWYGVSGAASNFMWPDSKEVEAGVERSIGDESSLQPQHDKLMLLEPEDSHDHISGSVQGLWSNGNAYKEQMSMDSINGATSSLVRPSFGSVLNGHAESSRVDKGEYLKRVGDGEGAREELFASNAGGKSRLLPMGDKLSLLTHTEAAMDGVVDGTKRQNLNKPLSKPPGKVKDGPVNGVTRLLAHGNGPPFKAVARATEFASFQPEGHLQQQYGAMYRPQSPPVLAQQHMRPPTLQQHPQASHGPSSSMFPHRSLRPQLPSPVYSNGNMDYEFDASAARTFPALGQVHFQPPPEAFHAGMTHQYLEPTQMLQHSPFFTSPVMPEHESRNHQVLLGASQGPSNTGQRQLLQSHNPQMGFMPAYSSEFSRAGSQSYEVGGHWGGMTSGWFGMEGSGIPPRPDLIQLQSLGPEADMKLRFG